MNEKPMIQHYIESRGHICMFLPKFHCELNPIEMLWGFMKYHASPLTDNDLDSYSHLQLIARSQMANSQWHGGLFLSASTCVTH